MLCVDISISIFKIVKLALIKTKECIILQECPDIWRQYHLTVSVLHIVRITMIKTN